MSDEWLSKWPLNQCNLQWLGRKILDSLETLFSVLQHEHFESIKLMDLDSPSPHTGLLRVKKVCFGANSKQKSVTIARASRDVSASTAITR